MSGVCDCIELLDGEGVLEIVGLAVGVAESVFSNIEQAEKADNPSARQIEMLNL